MIEEVTGDKRTVLQWLIGQHDEHPERDVFEVMGRLWAAVSGLDVNAAPLEVVTAYNAMTLEERNYIGSYATLPF